MPIALRERRLILEAAIRGSARDPDALLDAQRRLRTVLGRIGPDVDDPYRTGEPRRQLLANLAIALSGARDEMAAIRLGDALLADAIKQRNQAHRTVQENNQAVRKLKIGYIAATSGDAAGAERWLEQARVHAEAGLAGRLPENIPGRLLARQNLQRIGLELACLIPDREARALALKAIRIEAEAIYRESLNFVETRPLQRLSRGASVGAVLIEQARLSDDPDEIAELAWGARAYIRVHLDFYAGDADTEPAFEIRFGDACWMSDSPEKARETWERARDWAIRASQEDLVPALERRLSTGAPMFGEGVDYRGGSASPGSV